MPGKLLRASDPKLKFVKAALVAPMVIAAAAGDGKQATFEIVAYTGGPMQTSFSYYPVVLDLSGGRVERKKLPILYNHDDTRPVGQADAIQISAQGVRLAGHFTGNGADAQNIVAHAKDGFEWQASVGASVESREFLDTGKKTTVNGQEVTGPLMIARRWVLKETSVVALGADSKSSTAIAAKSGEGTDDMDFAAWLKAKNIEDFETLKASTQAALKAAYAAEIDAHDPSKKKKDPESPAVGTLTAADQERLIASAVKTALTEQRAELDRAAEISRILANHPDLLTKATAEKWNRDKAELEVLRASRPTGPFTSRGADREIQPLVIQAALCMSGGIQASALEKAFKPEVLEAAHSRYRNRLSLQQLLLEAAWASGYQGQHFDKSTSGLTAILRAAFSTLSLPGIFSNVANKFLLEGFNSVEAAWRNISAIRPVSDFKQVTSYRLTGDFTFEEVAQDGALTHADAGEESFTNQAKTFGRMFAITRQDIINDDLGALSVIPRRIGRGGMLKLNDVFWTEFLADANTFYTSGHGNYITGADTALSSAGLKEAVQAFRRQTDPDGKPLGITPAWLLVPPELESIALELNRSITVNTGGSSSQTQVPNSNIYGGRFPPIVSAYLTETAEWYMGASPNDLPLIETVFLNGVQQPTVEEAQADFDILGIQMRGYFDFGVRKQDYRAAVKSKGSA